jgi:isopenicillin-N epimerase
VFAAYQSWQRTLESQPTAFLGRLITKHLEHARNVLGEYVYAAPDDLVYFPNPTTAVNMVARSIPLGAGDEVLASNHEYGAMDRTWRFYARRKGFTYINHPISVPVRGADDFVNKFWQGVTERTKVIFLSHITSPTGIIFPIKEICRLARKAGIVTIIDGAHGPGQISLNLGDLGADIYAGALHKWLCAPKGAAFLYANKTVQPWLDPIVISWGYESTQPSGSTFIDYHEWQGTRDMSSFLSVPAAIKFQNDHHWETVRVACHQLAVSAQDHLNRLTGGQPLTGTDSQPGASGYPGFAQMVSVQIPACDASQLQSILLNRFRIEIPVIAWDHRSLLRISVQAYNHESDVQALIQAISKLLSEGYFRADE